MRPVIFLTGAPDSASLDETSGNLFRDLIPCFQRYLDREAIIAGTVGSTSTADANWRHVQLDGKVFYETPAPNRISIRLPGQDDSLLHTATRGAKSIHNIDFLEHSFAVLDNLQSSQIAPHASASDDEETTFVTTTSFTTSFSEDSSNISIGDTQVRTPVRQAIRIPGPITTIKALPNASNLLSLRPQTITVNLIVGVISVSPPKTVTVKRGNYTMDVIEVLVGDDTKAGFSVSSWVPPLDTQRNLIDSLRATLQSLRSGDVILVERLALSAFRDQVFGQTLNRRSTRNLTRFVKLDSNVTTSTSDQTGGKSTSAVSGKIQRVRDWVDGFVGPDRKRKAGLEEARRGKKVARDAPSTAMESLPPDTQ